MIFHAASRHDFMCPLQICNFRRWNSRSAINVSNIAGGSEKCGGLARVIGWPPLRAREVSRPTEQHGPQFLHKPETFSLDTERLPRRWCSLQAASGEAYKKRAQTFTTPYMDHLMTPWQLPRISGIIRFSEDSNSWIRHAAKVISHHWWLGMPLSRLHVAYECHKYIT